MVILDTNIIIDYLRQRGKAKTQFESLAETYGKAELGVSLITVQELYEGKSMSKDDEENFVLSILSEIKLLPYSFLVAQKAGELARNNKNYLEFEDAVIAATAILNSAKLATQNTKHFINIRGLELL